MVFQPTFKSYYKDLLSDPLQLKAMVDLEEVICTSILVVDEFEWEGQDTPPQIIIEDKKIVKLWIDNYTVSQLPESFGNLIHLRVLQLFLGIHSKLPDSLKNLTLLETLILNQSQLTIFPEFIRNSTNLKRLLLNDNKITEIPESIEKLHHLEELYISDNKLESLPKSLVNLKFLKELSLQNNKMELVLKNSQKIIIKLRAQGCSVYL